MTIEVDTLAPNTPFLDLQEADDLGRHNDDNITQRRSSSLSRPRRMIRMPTNHLELIPGGQNFKYRIYLRAEQGTELLIYDSAVDGSLPDLLDGLTAATQMVTPAFGLARGVT